MIDETRYVIEQKIVIRRGGTDQHVTIRLSEPRLEKDRDGDLMWACYPKLDGFIELEKPILEITSFRAVVLALASCRRLLRDACRGARIYMLEDMHGLGMVPDDGLSLKELFEIE